MAQPSGFWPVEKASQNFPRKRKTNLKYFLSGRVPGGKYFSGCKCGICMPTAYKLCAQQTAKRLAESPEGDFRQTQRRPKPPLFYWYRFRTRTHLTADARWASAATSSKTGGNYTFSQSENDNRVRSLCSDDVRA